LAGTCDRHAGRIQERYGISKEQSAQQFQHLKKSRTGICAPSPCSKRLAR
jgi:hypothetical protein